MFKLPIEYNKHTELPQHIINDLELLKLNESESFDTDSIFGSLFKVDNVMTKNSLINMTKFFSYDKKYLKDTQKIIKKYRPTSNNVDLNNVYESWSEIKENKNFKDTYNYFSWSILEPLNNTDVSLQVMTMYTLTSPLLSLGAPIFGLILPFIVIKLKGMPITAQDYVRVLKGVMKNHTLGRALISFDGADTNKKIYLLASVMFYFFSIYQNVMVCIRFVRNIKKIHEFLFLMRDYLNLVIQKMDMFGAIICKFKSYICFYNDMNKQCILLKKIASTLEFEPLELNIKKACQMGKVMNCFYQFYNNKEYEQAISYSFECIGFLDNLENISTQKLGKCSFSKHTSIKNMVYPALLHKKNTSNDITIDKNIVITGPNASGKTTVLKSTLINIILSQQIGYGCYESATIKLYKFLHCYLNIPDTSGRDSLFQAEARRCKEILDCIKKEKGEHFCIFDELYSGTNPDEAVTSANAFMNYLNTRADCLLTTHYTKLCHLLKNMNKCKMETIGEKYTYKLVSGISEVKGGIKILNDMNYPQEILNNI